MLTNEPKPNWLRIGIVLVTLAALAVLLGWSIHLLLDILSGPSIVMPTPPLSVTSTVAPSVLEPSVLPTAPPSSQSQSQEEKVTSTPRPTSTSAPTHTPSSETSVEIVQPGDGLASICRRHCPECWGLYEYPLSLHQYVQQVLRLNNKTSDYIKPGEQLRMPPCPVCVNP